MPTALEILNKSKEFLGSRGLEPAAAKHDSEAILARVLGLRKRLDLYLNFERVLTEPELAEARSHVSRRGKREPLQHILGDVEFDSLILKTDRRALIPRQETEELIEWTCARLPGPPARVLDLGTGSGALALALAKRFPGAAVTAVDRKPEALALARENAARLGLAGRVTFLESHWLSAVSGEFDLIVSNPPYLPASDLATAEPEVRDHEPRSALVAPEEGLSDLYRILEDSRKHLGLNGLLTLETGPDQHASLGERAAALGWTRRESGLDLSGRERFFAVRF